MTIKTNVPSVTAVIRTDRRYGAVVELTGPLAEMDRVDVAAVIATLGKSSLCEGRSINETTVQVTMDLDGLDALECEAGEAGDDKTAEMAREARETKDDAEGAALREVLTRQVVESALA
jgi:hypothetical protein